MRELPLSGCRRLRIVTGRQASGLLFLALFAAVDPAAAQGDRSEVELRFAPDSAVSSGSLFRKTLPFETEYLTRVAEMAVDRARAFMAERAAEANTVQTYVNRYGISRDLAQRIIDVAEAEGLDPELAFRMIRVESRFVVNARNPGGALGLTQLMPSTARSIDRTVNTEAEILDPQNNLRLGFRYLREMIDRYKGDVRLGVLAYNRGEVAVDRAIRSGRDPENGYSHLVLGTRSAGTVGTPYRGSGIVPKASR